MTSSSHLPSRLMTVVTASFSFMTPYRTLTSLVKTITNGIIFNDCVNEYGIAIRSFSESLFINLFLMSSFIFLLYSFTTLVTLSYSIYGPINEFIVSQTCQGLSGLSFASADQSPASPLDRVAEKIISTPPRSTPAMSRLFPIVVIITIILYVRRAKQIYRGRDLDTSYPDEPFHDEPGRISVRERSACDPRGVQALGVMSDGAAQKD